MHTKSCSENVNGRDHLEDITVDLRYWMGGYGMDWAGSL